MRPSCDKQKVNHKNIKGLGGRVVCMVHDDVHQGTNMFVIKNRGVLDALIPLMQNGKEHVAR